MDKGVVVRETAIAQGAGAVFFSPLLVSLLALGTGGAGAFAAAMGMCLAIPIFGWFFGLPMVIMAGIFAGMIWAMAMAALLITWGIYAFTMFVVALLRAR